jgi:hypothetical protein
LTAAIEAQQLERLVAAAYLLLHARLVGLEEIFDKAIVANTNSSSDASSKYNANNNNRTTTRANGVCGDLE